MEVNNNGMHSMAFEVSKQEASFNPNTDEIYKEIDRNLHVFESDAGGTTTTYYSMEFDNPLYLIEKLVEEIEKGRKAFSTALDKRGCMKPLALAKYFSMMNRFLSLYSASKVYTPHIDLFFETFMIKHGVMPPDFSTNPDAYSSLFKMKEGEFFNQLIEEISDMASQRTFKRKLYARTEAINRGLASAVEYLNALYDRYARLLVLRVDFGFRTENPLLPHTVGLLEAQENLARFFNNKRSKKLYTNLVGYIWRLEYGKEKGYHFHLFFFFDGSKAHKDEYLASEIGADWIDVTGGKGIYYNCNAHKQKYKRLGIGMISHDDKEMRQTLLDVLAYMHKEDQTLREKHTDKTHGWGRGTMPRPRMGMLGKPRRKPSC